MVRLLCLSVAVAASLLAAPRISIDVTPAVLFEGAAVRITCRVEPDANNRYLEWGLNDYRSSRVELEGADARRTHEWVITRVPCDPGAAFCRLRRVDEHDGEQVSREIQVSCQR